MTAQVLIVDDGPVFLVCSYDDKDSVARVLAAGANRFAGETVGDPRLTQEIVATPRGTFDRGPPER